MSTKTDDTKDESSKLTPDQKAAHEFLSELRTRITVQPLAYQHGVEATALESLWKVFEQAREAMKKHPGCHKFAALVTRMLNVEIRPMTAKWHRANEAGRLNSRDGGDEFRAELSALQVKLRKYAGDFHMMAYGEEDEDPLIGPAMNKDSLDRCMSPLTYGVPAGMPLDGGTTWADLNAAERAEVDARRMNAGAPPQGDPPAAGEDAAGLALSGGGIRSASFSLGVVQVLAERGLLDQFDFLSTVSGGGYTGSFLTSRLGTGTPAADIGKPQGPDTLPILCLRQRAKFLTARSLWESWGMVIATVAGLFMNWTVPLLLLTVLAIITTCMGMANLDRAFWGDATGWLGLAVIAAALAYFTVLRARGERAPVSGRIFVLFTVLFAFSGVVWVMHCAFYWLFAKDGTVPEWRTWPQFGQALTDVAERFSFKLAWAGGFAAVVPIILRFIPVLKNPAVRKWVIKIALCVAAIALPVLGAAVLLFLCAVGRVTVLPSSIMPDGFTLLLIGAAVLILIALFVLDINVTGPHRLYRNGLDKAFVQESEAEMDITPVILAGVDKDHCAPYHLINTAVNLPSGQRPGLRDRKCDFFLFSKHYCGSPVLGYQPTSEWKMSGQDADLGTAMAISGAAFSSNMGLGSIPSLRALLTFLNVRLGYWIRRPDKPGKWGLTKWMHPGFVCLLREMTGAALDENRRWVNLSDGGHIENMAVYELLRRRCKFIVCVDGECDPEFGFGGLMTLVRHAQIDFGIGIEPDVNRIKADPLTGYSQMHGLLARIHYPAAGNHAAGTGLLLYLKLSVTGNEPALINRYRRVCPEFPHQTTLDQFFDEEQFEAYRQLGVHAAEGMFSRTLMHDPYLNEPVPTASTAVPAPKMAMREWFRRLAANLLEPEPGDPPPPPVNPDGSKDVSHVEGGPAVSAEAKQ